MEPMGVLLDDRPTFGNVRAMLRSHVRVGLLDLGKYVKLTGILHRMEMGHFDSVEAFNVEYQAIANGWKD